MTTSAHAPMQQLGDETVRLLSSSQVITSVYAMVKELVENSLDAEASNIEVKLENFGRDLIEIRDNGLGISETNVPYLAQPHCTSKLSHFDHLASVSTYGFRGEALASIAAVASLVVTTCTDDDDVATTYTMDHSGQVIASKPSHLGRGTTVSVTNVFRNVPVRKQYFRSDKCCKEDLKKVEEVMLAFGIAHPGVRFVLKHNKNVIWQKLQTFDSKTNATLVLGSAVMQQLTPIAFQSFDPMLKVHGWVPRSQGDVTHISRATGDRLFLLVNQRPVVVKPIIQLIKQAFAEAYPSQSGRYPVAVLCIDVLPSDLDVNLEPNKTAVLFQNMEFITATLSRLFSDIYSPQPEDPAIKETLDSEPDLQQRELPVSRDSVQQNKSESTTLPRATMSQSGAEQRLVVNEEGSSTQKEPATPVDCGLGGDDPPASVTNTSITRSFEEDSSTSVTHALTLEPESYELLDISDLEESVEDFTHFSDGEDEVLGGKDDAGEKADSRAMGQASLKQLTLAGWSRGEALTGPAGTPIEPVKLLKPAGETARAAKAPPSKLAYKGPPPVFDMINSRPVKRKTPPPAGDSDSVSKKRKESPHTTSPAATSLLERWRLKRHEDCAEPETVTGSELPTETIICDLSGVERRKRAIDTGRAAVVPASHVIGYCEPPGCWLVVVDGNVACFNAARYKRGDAAEYSVMPEATLERQEVADLLADATGEDVNTSSNIFHVICSLKAVGD